MQIDKTADAIPHVQNQSTVFNSQDNKKIFKENLEKQEKKQSKVIECTELKISDKGHVMVLSNGKWIEFDKNMGDYEINYLEDGSVFGFGPGIVKNFLKNINNKSQFAIQRDDGFSSIKNGLALVPGKTVNLPDGTTLKWTTNGVQFTPRKTNNPNESAFALKYAASIAHTMAMFTRVANREAYGVGKVVGISREKTKEISTVLTSLGININNDFYVNGKKFSYDEKSGEFKYTFEDSIDGKVRIKYSPAQIIKMV